MGREARSFGGLKPRATASCIALYTKANPGLRYILQSISWRLRTQSVEVVMSEEQKKLTIRLLLLGYALLTIFGGWLIYQSNFR